jgi:hypothetical protein
VVGLSHGPAATRVAVRAGRRALALAHAIIRSFETGTRVATAAEPAA